MHAIAAGFPSLANGCLAGARGIEPADGGIKIRGFRPLRARDGCPERHELVFALDRSSGSRLRRVLLVEDHYFRGRSRPEALEAIVVLKPLFGPWRRIAVPVVFYRFAQVRFPRICAPPAVNWLAPSSDPGCAAAATLAAKENAKPKLRAPPPHRMRYHRIDRDRGFESRRQACRHLVERRFLGGEAEPSRAVSARLTVIAQRTVTCCQTTNAPSC